MRIPLYKEAGLKYYKSPFIKANMTMFEIGHLGKYDNINEKYSNKSILEEDYNSINENKLQSNLSTE